MARVPYLNRDDVPAGYQHFFDRPVNLVRALANSPEGMARFQTTGLWIRDGLSLDPRLRELAILQVGFVTRSPYEFSHHLRISRDFGVSDADRLAVCHQGVDGSELEPLGRLVVLAAGEITALGDLSDQTWVELERLLGRTAAVELVLVVAHYNAVVRVLGALRIDVEPDFAAELAHFPLPPPA